MKQYSVCFLFNEDLSEVLLVLKNRTDYAGRLNGVGGKLEDCDNGKIRNCALREIKEETSVPIEADELHWVCNLSLPEDCCPNSNEGITLGVYCAVADKNLVQQTTDEKLIWLSTDTVLSTAVTDSSFAGEGDVLLFVNLSRGLLTKIRET